MVNQLCQPDRETIRSINMYKLFTSLTAALMLALGVPGVASAAVSDYVLFVTCPGDVGVVFYNPGDEGLKSTMTITSVIDDGLGGDLSISAAVGDSYSISLGITDVSFCLEIFAGLDNFPLTGTVSNDLLVELNEDGIWDENTADELGVVVGTTLYAFITANAEINGSSLWYVSFTGEDIGGESGTTPTPDPLTYSTPTLNRNGISFTPDNFDPTCAYELSSTKGTVLQNPVTGEVTVYGVGSGSSVTVTITDCTGATATVSGTATAPTAPVIANTKPTITTSGTSLLCTAGTSSVTPTSVAYTLYMDGIAVSTKFTDTAIAPSLVPTSADQNSYSGATLSSASWTMDPAWANKVPSCVTTSLANGAVGIANS